jgi:hypothetical protein
MKIIAFMQVQELINKKLATYAASLFENGSVEVLDLKRFAMPF